MAEAWMQKEDSVVPATEMIHMLISSSYTDGVQIGF